MSRTIEVTMTFRAEVREGKSDYGQSTVDAYGPHELADAVRFHVDLSDLDSIEADISAFEMLDARETPRPSAPTEEELLAGILRRFIASSDSAYVRVDDDEVILDGRVEINDAERAILARLEGERS